jgi:tetratricopeptide (TPR) repeat protein
MTNTIVLFITLIVGFLSILGLFFNYKKKKAEDINAKIIFTKGVLIVIIFVIMLNVINPLYNYIFPGATYYNSGNIWLRKGDKDRALVDFSNAIQLNPNYAEAYYTRGIVYSHMGIYQKAIEDLNKAIALKQKYAEAYNNRGAAYINLGQYQQAIEDLNKAIALKQEYADAYNNRGAAYLLQGNTEIGCPNVQKACELGSCNALKVANDKGYCL